MEAKDIFNSLFADKERNATLVQGKNKESELFKDQDPRELYNFRDWFGLRVAGQANKVHFLKASGSSFGKPKKEKTLMQQLKHKVARNRQLCSRPTHNSKPKKVVMNFPEAIPKKMKTVDPLKKHKMRVNLAPIAKAQAADIITNVSSSKPVKVVKCVSAKRRRLL